MTVAQAVGVTHNAPYSHFADRNDLLAAIAGRDLKMLAAGIEAARANDSPALERLRSGLDTFVEYGRHYPARYRLMFSDPNIVSAGSAYGLGRRYIATPKYLAAKCRKLLTEIGISVFRHITNNVPFLDPRLTCLPQWGISGISGPRHASQAKFISAIGIASTTTFIRAAE